MLDSTRDDAARQRIVEGGTVRAARAYGNLERQTSVMISDRVGLVSLLYDKLLQRLQEARTAIDVNDVPTRASAISKAIELIEVGLLSSLDGARGGDIALRLRGHYQLWLAKLLEANLNASPVLLQEVDAEVRTIKSAWDELRSTTTVARNP